MTERDTVSSLPGQLQDVLSGRKSLADLEAVLKPGKGASSRKNDAWALFAEQGGYWYEMKLQERRNLVQGAAQAMEDKTARLLFSCSAEWTLVRGLTLAPVRKQTTGRTLFKMFTGRGVAIRPGFIGGTAVVPSDAREPYDKLLNYVETTLTRNLQALVLKKTDLSLTTAHLTREGRRKTHEAGTSLVSQGEGLARSAKATKRLMGKVVSLLKRGEADVLLAELKRKENAAWVRSTGVVEELIVKTVEKAAQKKANKPSKPHKHSSRKHSHRGSSAGVPSNSGGDGDSFDGPLRRGSVSSESMSGHGEPGFGFDDEHFSRAPSPLPSPPLGSEREERALGRYAARAPRVFRWQA
ncbi:hypothetical protein JCM10207_001592 [Rhodosporidiobolus poonsookiae]